MPEARRRPRIGFVGIGDQGGAIAERIAAAGLPISVWARRPEAAANLVTLGARLAGTIEELAARSDILCICVVDDGGTIEIVERALLALAIGTTIVIHSTVAPTTCTRLAAQAAQHGVTLVDAPVSGGGGGARAGTLTVMVGGPEETLAACRPMFETFAGSIIHLGPVGTGQSAKLVNNALLAANLAMADEAVAIATHLGIGLPALAEIVKVSSGRSFGFEVRASLPTLAAFAGGGALLRKDVRLLAEALNAVGLSATPLAASANAFLDRVDAAAADPSQGA